MDRRCRFSWLALGAVILLPQSAVAQPTERPTFHASINGAWQVATITFDEQFEFEASFETGQFKGGGLRFAF